jgi:hypothetical protein
MCSSSINAGTERKEIEENRINNKIRGAYGKNINVTIGICPIYRKTKEFFRSKSTSFEFMDYDLSTESEKIRKSEKLELATSQA